MPLHKAGLTNTSHLSGKIHISKLRIVEMDRDVAERSGNGAGEDALAAKHRGNGKA